MAETSISGTDLGWRDEEVALAQWAEPLLGAQAFQRLVNVTFLGGLSRRFTSAASGEDGSRAQHSVGVASLALRVAERFRLSDEAKRLAVAWGLTHDVSTWALSHTSEPAFSLTTHVNQSKLRALIIVGDKCLAPSATVSRALREMGVAVDALLGLFDKKNVPANREHALLWHVFHSPMTPDSLEGIWRAGTAFDVPVSHPFALIDGLELRDGVPAILAPSVECAVNFWKAKACIYHDFIYAERPRTFESAWALALRTAFRRMSVMHSLEITEDDILRRVPPPRSHQLAFGWGEMRFRSPANYVVGGRPSRCESLPLASLSQVLQRIPSRI